MGTIFPGPTPPYSNPPINPQYFQPSVFFITNIVLGTSTLITTSINHNYVIGQNTRLLIPPQNGSYQLNGLTGYVTSIPGANQVVLNIDSQNANPYISSPTYSPERPQIVAIGDINSGIISSTGRVLTSTNIPGAFINISPL